MLVTDSVAPQTTVRLYICCEVAVRDEEPPRLTRVPTGRTFESWRKQDSSIEMASGSALRPLEWVGTLQNLSISGPSSTGNTGVWGPPHRGCTECPLRLWAEELAMTVARFLIVRTSTPYDQPKVTLCVGPVD